MEVCHSYKLKCYMLFHQKKKQFTTEYDIHIL